jgi:hypothetical protein
MLRAESHIVEALPAESLKELAQPDFDFAECVMKLSSASSSSGWVGCTQNCALGIETDHEVQIFGQGINFFHIENWYSVHSVIRTTLKLMGLCEPNGR